MPHQYGAEMLVAGLVAGQQAQADTVALQGVRRHLKYTGHVQTALRAGALQHRP